MRELSLFTGAGGGLLASILLGWQTIGAVEHDKYCCKVLDQRQQDGHLEGFPIWNMDVREFNERVADRYRHVADVVSAGFPCQPFSVAGKRTGADDERNMWPATLDCIRKVRPRFAFLENVPGLISSGYFDTILGDLAESGYNARWCVLGADTFRAPHIRKRLWVVAESERSRARHKNGEANLQGRDASEARTAGIRQTHGQACASGADAASADVAHTQLPKRRSRNTTDSELDNAGNGISGEREEDSGRIGECGEEMADADAAGLEERQGEDTARKGSDSRPLPVRALWWAVEPDVGRVVNGLAHRVDRLKALGNGQVPIVAAAAWRLLTGDVI